MVHLLRDAGAVLVGKTNMHRLGGGTTSLESDFGPVVNPWNPRRVPGGPSGGSAVPLATALRLRTGDRVWPWPPGCGWERWTLTPWDLAGFRPRFAASHASSRRSD